MLFTSIISLTTQNFECFYELGLSYLIKLYDVLFELHPHKKRTCKLNLNDVTIL